MKLRPDVNRVYIGIRQPAFAMMEGSHSGLVRPPAKRVGGVELPRGFESHSLRHPLLSNVV